MFQRRVFKTVAVGVFCLGIATSSCRRQSAVAPFTLKEVGSNVWAAIDNPTAAVPAAANAGFVIGDDGVVVIDTFWNADAARQLLAEIRKRTNLPVKYVVNTHYHLDHVAGNGVFTTGAAALVFAHRNVRDWIHTENLRLLGPAITPELKDLTESVVPPDVVYERGVNLHLGGREIQIHSFPGHTGGDSIVVIPDVEVVFAGDLVWRNMLPTLIDASTEPWIDTLDAVLTRAEPARTFVPGHGDVASRDDVAAFRDYLATLRAQVMQTRAQGKSGDTLARAVLPVLKETYGRWDFADPVANANIREVEAELSGTKRTLLEHPWSRELP